MALEFDGINDYLTVPNSNDWAFGSGNFTISFWVKFNDYSGRQDFLGQYVAPEWENQWNFQKSVDNKLVFINYVGGVEKANYEMTDAWPVNVDQWYHLVLVRNTTSILFYIDGISQTLTEITAISTNAMIDVAGVLKIALQASPNFVNGSMYDFRIYKGIALSLQKIQSIYHSRGSDNIVNGLVGRWLMNEKPDGSTATVASSVIDISGNGNHGTPANSPVYRAAPIKLIRRPR